MIAYKFKNSENARAKDFYQHFIEQGTRLLAKTIFFLPDKIRI